MAQEQFPHSAGGQALGYVYQCLWALVELGRRSKDDPSTELRLEALDDIQFDNDGSPIELLQIKHHIRSVGTLTAQSTDLWRTLNVWMDLPDTNIAALYLVTTQQLDESSGLRHLRNRSGSRDLLTAIKELTLAARNSNNASTEGWRKKFLHLDEGTRESLVDRVVIVDDSTAASDVDSELKKIFRYAYPPGQGEVFLRLLEGWWYGIAVRLLDRTLHSITGRDLIAQVGDITDQLRSNSLPIDPDIRIQVGESVLDVYQDREFVQQLVWIALDHDRLWKAVRDYHRSYTQRSFWFRYQLLSETELDRFAFCLHDEWEQIFDTHMAKMRRENRTDAEIVGQEILEDLARDSRSKLRDRFDQPWFNRGMLHALADGEFGYRIGWHPDFETRLERLLNNGTVN